jgi:plastocyanin
VKASSPSSHHLIASAAGLVFTLVLAACSGAGSAPSSMPPMSMGSTASASTAPNPSGPLRCAVTPDVSPSATIKITTDKLGIYQFGAPVTIKVGQAVVFSNGNNAPHTITEGSNGQAATNACVDVGISQSAKVTVTFYLAGDYHITCRPHPPMNTAVHVK